MKKKIRIGNAGGYWGDDLDALRRQLLGGPLDYITMDFLAEITMSILRKQQLKNPALGYAGDFLTQLETCLPLIVEKNVKVINNAGGINPVGLGRQILAMARSQGHDIKVGVVYGDDISGRLYELTAAGEKFTNMETGEDFTDVRRRITSANVYLGAEPVVAALDAGCQIVVTGRVTDTGLTLAPMIHEFGWAMDDWDRMAAGIVAGHIIECGAQASGGNITDWQSVPHFHNMGYPIIEMHRSGEFFVTKHKRTGGQVSEKSVKEQLVYEMGDPAQYISPDGVAFFDTIRVEETGPDRVNVSGVRGGPAPEMFKVSMAYDDGWKAEGEILVSGPEIRKKAAAVEEIFWEKVGHEFEQTSTALVGAASSWPDAVAGCDPNEIYLRFGVRDHDRAKIMDFSKALPALILAGPSGMAVSTQGRPRPRQVVAYWPALMRRDGVTAKVLTFDTNCEENFREIQFPLRGEIGEPVSSDEPRVRRKPAKFTGRLTEVKLRRLCYARSGDKGDTCNIGILARSPRVYDWMVAKLTAPVVKKFFKGRVFGKVTRYQLENLEGLNFLLEQSLGGGGTTSLLVDPQGKTMSQALLEMKVKVPVGLLRGLK
ncbi:MAG: acyclic terpene utilization AtuA family protein [Candidatus Krumholzibacteriota bacterium]